MSSKRSKSKQSVSSLHSPSRMPSSSITPSYPSSSRPSAPSDRFSQSRDGFGSPDRSKSTVRNIAKKKTCMCSPTTHPGSFRCSLHKNMMMTSHSSNRLNVRRSAMTNSLVRYGKSDQREGDLVKRALAALIRPSSHHQRRRTAFEPKPSHITSSPAVPFVYPFISNGRPFNL